VGVPIACRKMERTMTILVKEVIATIIVGRKDRTVKITRNFTEVARAWVSSGLRVCTGKLSSSLIGVIIILLLPLKGLKAGIGEALYRAANYYDVPFLVLVAIADVESSFHPYAINVNLKKGKVKEKFSCPSSSKCFYHSKGFSVFCSSRKECEKFLKYLHKKGYNYDIGLMQINRLWIDKYGLNPESLFDPYYNALWGAYILKRLILRYGLPSAIWKYNGSKGYLEKVQRKLDLYIGRKNGE